MRPAIARGDFVRDSGFLDRHRLHLRFRNFSTLADGVRHFIALAQTVTHPALSIAHDDQGAEAETPAALDDFRGAIDEHDLLSQIVARLLARAFLGLSAATTWRSSARALGSLRALVGLGLG